MSIDAPTSEAASLRKRFEELPAPNYKTQDAWFRQRFHGGKIQDPAVFYVHPTTVRTLEAWFSSHLDPVVLADTRAIVEEHGHAFPGNMWAPAYRQATTRAFHQYDRGGEQAYNLAFEDVWRAFLAFLHEVPDGPIVLAGHSQGARHVVHILAALAEDVIPDARDVVSRIVVAYAIGIGIPNLPGLLTQFPLPVTREETGVLVGWNAMLKGFVERDGAAGTAGNVDPVSFCVTSPLDMKPLHQGGAPAPFDGIRVSVESDGDAVWVCQLEGDDLALYALPNGSLHAVEIQLFARDISDDLRRRTRVWRATRSRRSNDDRFYT